LKVKLGHKNKKSSKTTEDDTELDLELARFQRSKKKERRALITVITLLIVFAIFLTSIIILSGEKKTSQLSAYSDRWNDISKFRENLIESRFDNGKKSIETRSILSSPTVLKNIKNPEDYVYVAIGIEKEYSEDEVTAIIDFVYSGGSIIIADDFGYGNSLSETVTNSEESFNTGFFGKQLWDENFLKDPQFIKINVHKDESGFFEGVILLNNATALMPHQKSESWYGKTLVSSSNKGWIDVNGDGHHSPLVPGEEMGRKSIVQEIRMGDGKALFVSDPSIFINDMWNRENNSAFALAMIEYLFVSQNIENRKYDNSTKYVIFDESLHIQEDILSNTRQSFFQGLVGFTSDTQLAILIGILGLLFLGVLIIIVENPPELRHRFNIEFYNLNNLLTTDIVAKDSDRIRYIFLERLRIAHGMSSEEFKELAYDELENMIQDDDLVDFAMDWKKKYYGQELEDILLKIRDYE